MTTPEERERTRRELHALAEFARPASADSSGYVDLSTFSASDPNWVENALARARGEHPEPAGATAHRIDSLEAESLAPVEMSRLLDAESGPPVTGPRRTYAILGVVWALGLAGLACFLAGRSPPPVSTRAVAVAAPPIDTPPPPSVVSPAPQELPVVATPASAPSPATQPARHASPKHLVAPPRTRSAVRPSTRLAAPPMLPKSTGGGDSLMNAIQQSFSGGAKN